MSDREELQIAQSFANRLLLEENTKLKAQLQKANDLLEDFMMHYNDRVITNGYHDLLAKDINEYFKENNNE